MGGCSSTEQLWLLQSSQDLMLLTLSSSLELTDTWLCSRCLCWPALPILKPCCVITAAGHHPLLTHASGSPQMKSQLRADRGLLCPLTSNDTALAAWSFGHHITSCFAFPGHHLQLPRAGPLHSPVLFNRLRLNIGFCRCLCPVSPFSQAGVLTQPPCHNSS